MKALIFDTGSLINLSMNGLLYILPEMKKSFKGKFLITQDVKYETIDRPLKVPRFELGALRVDSLINQKVLENPQSLGIKVETIKKQTKVLMEQANHYIRLKGRWIKIVSDAEMSCLALSSILSEKGVENIIAIDERTTRILSEKPQNLEKLMSRKLHANVSLTESNFDVFSKFRFIRSTELVYVAYKKGILRVKGPKVLEAALFATKFKGSSVSFDELKVLKKL